MDDKRKQFEANNWVESGKSWIKRSNLDKAEYSLKKALDIIPGHKEASAILKKVQELRRDDEVKKQEVQMKKEELAAARRARIESSRAADFMKRRTQFGSDRPRKLSPKISEMMDKETQRRKALTQSLPKCNIDAEHSKLITAGIRNLGNQNFKTAISKFSKATKDFPESYLGWLYLGDARVFSEDLKNGLKAHKTAAKIEPSCNFPKLEAKAKNGIVVWNIEIVSGYAVKEIWQPQVGIFTELGPLTFGSQNWTVKFPDNCETSMERTYSLWTLTRELHPDVGSWIAFDKMSLQSEMERRINSRVVSGHRDSKMEDAFAFETIDRIEEARDVYLELLESNPLDLTAQRGLYRTLTRLISGPNSLESFHQFPMFKSLLSSLPEMRLLMQNPLLRKAQKSRSQKFTEYEILQLQLRSFDLVEKS